MDRHHQLTETRIGNASRPEGLDGSVAANHRSLILCRASCEKDISQTSRGIVTTSAHAGSWLHAPNCSAEIVYLVCLACALFCLADGCSEKINFFLAHSDEVPECGYCINLCEVIQYDLAFTCVKLKTSLNVICDCHVLTFNVLDSEQIFR